MKLYPAIDLRGGQAVRLYQGDYDQMTVYNADPAAQAREFIAAGAKYLHVVDLDGAKDDTTANMTTIAAIAKQGELVVNSIDTDGVKNGFDLELLDAVAQRCAVPIIASGGAGKMDDFKELFLNHPRVDAGLAASIFHTKQVDIRDLKLYLRENGVEMRV